MVASTTRTTPAAAHQTKRRGAAFPEFRDEDDGGRILKMWEVPLEDYLASGPMSHDIRGRLEDQPREYWVRLHRFYVAHALEEGLVVPPDVLSAYTEEELAPEREKIHAVLFARPTRQLIEEQRAHALAQRQAAREEQARASEASMQEPGPATPAPEDGVPVYVPPPVEELRASTHHPVFTKGTRGKRGPRLAPMPPAPPPEEAFKAPE